MLSTLHKCSALGVKNDLELFDLPPTQFSHEGHEFLEFYPSSTKPEETDAIEFHIPNVGKNYLDPSAIFLYVKARIVRGGGGLITRSKRQAGEVKPPTTSATGASQVANTDNDIVAPVDNFINSMFQHVDVYFNQKLITRHEYYAYRSYLDLLLRTNNAMQKSTLWPLLFDRDYTPVNKIAAGFPRLETSKNSSEFEGITPIFSDICQQGKLLLNGVDIRVSLRQNPDAFRLISPNATGDYKLEISKIMLFVRQVQIAPSVLIAHEKRLQVQPAVYAIRGVETKIRSIHPNSSDIYFEGLFPERVPARLTVVFIKQSSFYGRLTENPFKFENLNMEKAKLMIGSREIVETFDFQKGHFARAFLNFVRHVGNPLLHFTKEDFINNAFMLHYILTPDCSDEHFSIPSSENVRLHIQLKAPLSEAYTAVLMSETPRVIEINEKREVEVK